MPVGWAFPRVVITTSPLAKKWVNCSGKSFNFTIGIVQIRCLTKLEIFYPSSSAILLQSLLLNFLTMFSSVSKPPIADVVCESSPINLLSPAGHSPSLLSAVPFQLLSEGVTMSLDISTEGQSVPLHGSSVLFHVLNFLTEGGMCL